MNYTLFFSLILVLSVTVFCYGAIVYVPGDKPTIQAGINAASDGDTVLVADGIYTGDGNRDIDFDSKAIIVKSENGPESTIIDCQGTSGEPHRGFSFRSGESTSSMVDGFTIKNGYAPLEPLFGGERSVGGGIYCYQSSPTIKNNMIYNNRTREVGAAENGGGIYVHECSPIIENNIIESNQAILGGGIYFYQSSPSIKNNLIVSNSAWENGGGIYCNDSSTSVINNTIVNNSAVGNGSGIYSYSFPLTITNSIVWGNNIYLTDSSLDISYSCIQDGINGIGKHATEEITYQNNIEDDPMFGNPYSGYTYDLKPGSPCINAGTSSGAPSTDIVERPRPSGSGVDIGAYEQNDEGTLAVTLSTFTASASSSSATLKWHTETEVGNVGFTVYRSSIIDGNYTEIGFVNGAGNSGMPRNYQFTDKDVEQGQTYFYYLEDIDITGERSKSDIIKVVIPSALPVPKEFKLLQNYPNPFNPETWIPYQLAQEAQVTISICNTKGQLIRTINLGNKRAGVYVTKDKAAQWDGRDGLGEKVASSVYYYTLQVGNFTAIRKMVILK